MTWSVTFYWVFSLGESECRDVANIILCKNEANRLWKWEQYRCRDTNAHCKPLKMDRIKKAYINTSEASVDQVAMSQAMPHCSFCNG